MWQLRQEHVAHWATAKPHTLRIREPVQLALDDGRVSSDIEGFRIRTYVQSPNRQRHLRRFAAARRTGQASTGQESFNCSIENVRLPVGQKPFVMSDCSMFDQGVAGVTWPPDMDCLLYTSDAADE